MSFLCNLFHDSFLLCLIGIDSLFVSHNGIIKAFSMFTECRRLVDIDGYIDSIYDFLRIAALMNP